MSVDIVADIKAACGLYIMDCKDVQHYVRVALPFSGNQIKYVTAMLHDTVEDGILTIEQIELIDEYFMFAGCLTSAIKAISKKEEESYFTYIDKVKGNSLATEVKISDLLDNLRIPLKYDELNEDFYNTMVFRNVKYRRALGRLILK